MARQGDGLAGLERGQIAREEPLSALVGPLGRL